MPPDSPTVEPVVVTTKAALVAAVADGVARALDTAQEKAEPDNSKSNNGFGWLPLKRVQQLTGWSKATLARRRSSGELPYSLVGQSVFVHVDDLRALMERHRTAPQAPFN